jgi:hypothetical protein
MTRFISRVHSEFGSLWRQIKRPPQGFTLRQRVLEVLPRAEKDRQGQLRPNVGQGLTGQGSTGRLKFKDVTGWESLVSGRRTISYITFTYLSESYLAEPRAIRYWDCLNVGIRMSGVGWS